MKLSCRHLAAALIAAATLAPALSGAVTVSGSGGTVVDTSLFPGATTQITYDGPNGPLVASDIGGTLNRGTPVDGGNWSTVGVGESAVVTFRTLLDYVGFAWGTPDTTFNTFQLFNGNTQVGQTFIGDDANGGDFVNFLAAGPSEYFNRIVFASGTTYFEFDNIAARGVGVPEPGGLALILAALGLLGLSRRNA